MTPPRGVTPHALLELHVDSLEKLEVVRALRAASAPMTHAELAVAARLPLDTVRDVVARLTAVAVTDVDRADRVALGAAARTPAFEAVLACDDQDRSALLPALSAIAVERIRTMAVQAFVRTKKRDEP